MSISVTPLSKPAPREKRGRTRIARSSRPARVRRTVAGKDRESLSLLFSRVIRERDPRCWVGLLDICSGMTTDAAHILGKGRAPSIRWDLRNAVGLCRKCHMHFTARPEAWDLYCLRQMGVGTMAILTALAQMPKPDRQAARDALIAERNRLRTTSRSN